MLPGSLTLDVGSCTWIILSVRRDLGDGLLLNGIIEEKMDLYSLGLLCLWLFSFDEEEYICDHIRAELPAIVDELLIEEATQAVTLRRALRLSLERNPTNRLTFLFLSQLLESTGY